MAELIEMLFGGTMY